MDFDLEQHRVDCPQDDVFYIPNFITEEEENYLFQKINDAPKPKWKTLSNRRLQVWGGEITFQNTLISQPLPPFLKDFPNIIRRLRDTGVFASSKHQEPNHVIINEYFPGQGIMPHEDGPSYYPVVCTISLGSHAVFNYYRYRAANESGEQDAKDTKTLMNSEGRSIDTRPIVSVLLERRSLIITRSSLYSEHLHGIDPLIEDLIVPISPKSKVEGNDFTTGVSILNYKQLADDGLRGISINGGRIRRDTRISLTCRDVERVINAVTQKKQSDASLYCFVYRLRA